MKSCVLSPCALCDADEARRWYETRQMGLGLEFVQALDKCLSDIEAQPELYRIFRVPYRKTLLRRFPYQVVYEIRNDCLWVLAVYHTSRNPSGLTRRLS
jgi:toxin ParE1/3/4